MEHGDKPRAMPSEKMRITNANAVSSEPFDWSQVKTTYVYEGTDSDDDGDDEKVMKEKSASIQVKTSKTDSAAHSREISSFPINFEDHKLEKGQLCEGGASFCPWTTIRKYPYVYIGNSNRDKVALEFFDDGKAYERTWDFYYLYRSTGADPSQTAFILVPTKQFEHFLNGINKALNINLSIPAHGDNPFRIVFDDDGTPRPRYLGQANNKAMAENLRNTCPPSYFKLDSEDNSIEGASQRSLVAFKGKIDMITQAQKNKKKANKEKQKAARIVQQQFWNHSIKRVQRYLGIRQASQGHQLETIKKGQQISGLALEDYDAAVQAAASKLRPSTNFNPNKPAPYDQDGSVVFISIDVEAYERDKKLITEIGISTLDTDDIRTLVPGKGGINWLSAIRARHFRINEYKHLRNFEFVAGCADKFEFGDSEFINLKDAPHVISTCFKYPFSNPSAKATEEELPKRNIILVGHDVGMDVTYFRNIGYDIYNLSNLLEVVDTSSMWKYVKRESNPRNLGAILAELDITGWNLHNAGNDATYTLQAMVKIAIKALEDRGKEKDVKKQEIKERVAEAVKEAAIAAWEHEQGWSSGGENSDGGAPISPVPPPAPGASKRSKSRNDDAVKDSQEPWRPANEAAPSSWGTAIQFGGPLKSESTPNKPDQPAATKVSAEYSEKYSRLTELLSKSKISESQKPVENGPGW